MTVGEDRLEPGAARRVRQAVLERVAAVRRRRARRAHGVPAGATRCSPRCTSRRTPTPGRASSARIRTTGPRQAHGLCFSVQDGVALPPSLVNIYTELQRRSRHRDAAPRQPRVVGTQGVLLLNTCLTVRSGAGRIAPGQGLGDVHRRGAARGRRQAAPRGVHPVGCASPRKKKALIDLVPTRRDRVGAPVTAQRAQRVLRQPAVQPHQRMRSSRPACPRSTGASPNRGDPSGAT